MINQQNRKIEINLNEEVKFNKKFAIRKAAINFLNNYVASLAIGSVAYYFFDLNLRSKTIYYLLLILALVLFFFNTLKYYKRLKSFMDVLDIIEYLKDKENPKGRIKQNANRYNVYIERAKLKLDLLKSFSPIPIIVFILGLIFSHDIGNISSKNKTLAKVFNIFQTSTLGSVSLKTIVLIGIIVFLIVYFFAIFKTWERYKFNQNQWLEYQNAYDKLKEEE